MQKSTIVSKKELSNISFSFERGGQNENESFGKKSRNIHQVQQKTNESKKKNEKRKERARKIVEVTNAPTTNQNQYSICRIQAVWVDGGHDVSIPNPNSNELKQWTERTPIERGKRTNWMSGGNNNKHTENVQYRKLAEYVSTLYGISVWCSVQCVDLLLLLLFFTT